MTYKQELTSEEKNDVNSFDVVRCGAMRDLTGQVDTVWRHSWHGTGGTMAWKGWQELAEARSLPGAWSSVPQSCGSCAAKSTLKLYIICHIYFVIFKIFIINYMQRVQLPVY